MVTLYAKSIYSIAGKISFQDNSKRFEFSVPVEEKEKVRVVLMSGEKNIYVFYVTKISDAFYQFLQQSKHEIPENFSRDYLAFTSGISSAVERVLSLIKYHLGHFNLREHLIAYMRSEWSSDNINWNILPTSTRLFVDEYSTFPVDDSNASLIQKYIDIGYEPFIALRYLHKAKLEEMPHHKWIEATTAAELAIKEFLIRFKPEIETLLVEMPSPPIYKLYGLVLESLGLQKFPLAPRIQNGIEKRNHLVHRPKKISITMSEANEYTHLIEFAIYHLILLLHPDDPYIKAFYDALKLEFKL